MKGRLILISFIIFIALLQISAAQFWTPSNPLNNEVQCCIALSTQDPRIINDACSGLQLDSSSCGTVLEGWQAQQTDVIEENSYLFAGLVLFILGAVVLLVILAIAAYIYTSFAFMYIGRKTGAQYPEIAWIPLIGKPLLSSHMAKMHWWPILLLIAPIMNPFLIFSRELSYLITLTVIVFVASLVFTVYYYIWRWKMFVSVGRPGAWVLFKLIPFVGFIIYFALLGIAAWGKTPIKKRAEEIKARYKKQDKKKTKRKKK